MASDDSGEESTFTDCAASGVEQQDEMGAPLARSSRQISVAESFQRGEKRRYKRPAPDRSSKSPRDPASPAAKRPVADPGGPAGVELSPGALEAIRRMVDSGIAAVISAFEKKFESMERRINVLETEVMDRDLALQNLSGQLAHQVDINARLRAQVESIDLNRRLSSLILTSEEFSNRSPTEDMEKKVTLVLNDRIPGLNLTVGEIQAAHRLQRDDKVIVRFVKRSTRDKIYEARFSLASHEGRSAGAQSGVGYRGGPRLASLYITESLTAYNQGLYNQLLQVRRSSGGATVASVFSRRGLVYCRTTKNGPNIRIPDEAALQRVIGSAGRAPPPPPVSGVPGARPGHGTLRPGAPAPPAQRGGGPPLTFPARLGPPAPIAAGEPSGGVVSADPSVLEMAAGSPMALLPTPGVGGPPSAAAGAPSRSMAPAVVAAGATSESVSALTSRPLTTTAFLSPSAAESAAPSAADEVTPPAAAAGAPSAVSGAASSAAVSGPPGGAVG